MAKKKITTTSSTKAGFMAFRCPDPVRELVQMEASKQGRSMSSLILEAVSEYLKKRGYSATIEKPIL
jgi:predicted HicB family RNase H-like nuclease